jgi:membrane-bound lytic murein transglycosylase B
MSWWIPNRIFARYLWRSMLALSFAMGFASLAAADPFADWLSALRKQAAADGISQPTIDAGLGNLKPIQEVLDLDRHQPEFILTFAQYRAKVVNEQRVARGRNLLKEYGPTLDRVAAEFGVQPRFIVALWAVESDYGHYTGGYSVIAALATLAYASDRKAFFRAELIDALHIVDERHISVALMMGSWAGAMGQCQFMPSSFRRYAVDFDGDGRRDIWTSQADVFASIANYLASLRWRRDQTWGREVRLPAKFNAGLVDLRLKRTLPQWQRMGVRNRDGSDLPAGNLEASLVAPDGLKGSAYLVYSNYKVLMRWNYSSYFATAVGLLADRLAGG